MKQNPSSTLPMPLILMLALLLGGCGEASAPSEAGQPGANTIAGLDAILEMPYAVTRAAALAEWLEGLDPSEASEVAAALAPGPGRGGLDEVSAALLASWWVGFDPEAAYASELASSASARGLWKRTVLREWAQREPLAVLAVVEALPRDDQDLLRDAMQALILGWFRRDAPPEDLLPAIEPLPLGRLRNEVIDQLLNTMADRRGTDATIAFVEALPASDSSNFKLQSYRRLATTLAQRDPQRAVAWAQAQADGPYGKNLLRRVGARRGWVEGEPAMEWALSLPETQERAAVVRETYRGFRMRARDRAEAWMREREPSPAVEPAYALFLAGIAREDPQEALALTDGIEDRELRERLIVSAGRSWLRSDPEAASRWLEGLEGLESSGLTPELASRIRTGAAPE